MSTIAWDYSEDHKVQVFSRLNQLAKSRRISILYVWRTMQDYREYDDLYFQSSGATGQVNTCVFCGKWPLSADPIKLGAFSCDGDCFYEMFIEQSGHNFLDPTGYRPSVIVVDASVPGSLDNVILGLAWGLGVYRRSLRRPNAQQQWVDTSAEDFAVRLVRRVDKQLQEPKALVAPLASWVC